MLRVLFLLILSQSLFANIMVDSLKYLSSDQLKGRRAGSKENHIATDYLIKELKKLGVAGVDGKYKQEFTIFTEMIKNGANEVSLNGVKGDFEPVSFSNSGEVVDAPVVFVGYGITIPASDPNLKYDDYAGINVEGKIVIILTGDPGIGNPNSPFRNPTYLNYQSLNFKLSNAAAHKAKGVLVIQDPMSLPDPNKEPALYFNSQEGGGKRFSVLAGFSTNKWINTLSKEMNTLTLQKKIADTQKPVSFELPKVKLNLSVHLKKETGRVSNVLGFIEGSDETLKKEVVVLGAHFDHLGMGGQSSMEPSRDPKIHNGADDNASGTSLVLKMAKIFKGLKPKRSILFAFFNAEEEGLLGSSHMVSSWGRLQPTYGDLYAMINFDMVGRFDKEVSLMGTGSAFEWKAIIDKIKPIRSLPVRSTKLAVGSSDHAPFIQNKVPALFFTTGAHEDYHRASDDFEKIDLLAMEKLVDFARRLILEIVGEELLTFNPDAIQDEPGRNRGYGAHLGCVPQFGQSDDIIGVLCTRTVPASPAENAGVIGGDVIVQIGDIDIKNIYDLAFALRYYRSGDKITLGWRRGTEIMKKEITLTTRDGNKSTHHHNGCHHPPIL